MTILTLIAVSSEPSPYAGERSRPVKSLSDRELEGLRAGAGLGFAKPAELNSFPGPKHVLELAEALELSAEQREATERSYEKMHAAAVRLGERLIEQERALEALFADRSAEPEPLRRAVHAAGLTRAELRLAHLAAHLETAAVLTAHQIQRYDVLRGYREPPEDCPHSAR